MQVIITFRNMFATEALRNHVNDKLAKVVDKYLDKVTEAHVTLSLERYLHQADINLHAGHFHVRGRTSRRTCTRRSTSPSTRSSGS